VPKKPQNPHKNGAVLNSEMQGLRL